MNKMVATIKEIHAHDICIFKIGNFGHCYGRDACIMSYIFGYKLKSIENNNRECGFPLVSMNKVVARLEEKKISYLIIDKRNNYEVDEKIDFKNLNKHDEIYEKSRIYVNYKNRVDNITNYLNENIETKDFRKVLFEIEEIIDERRKI